MPSAGYIQAYPPGVRENGGQYSHAGVWALMAQAQFHAEHATTLSDPHDGGDTVYRYFTYLSPAHRARHATHGAAYGIEPYVMAGDVYTQPPHVGRGGWSWYTGCRRLDAPRRHRVDFRIAAGRAGPVASRRACPRTGSEAEITLRRDGRTMRFILIRATARGPQRSPPAARVGVPTAPPRSRPCAGAAWRRTPAS